MFQAREAQSRTSASSLAPNKRKFSRQLAILGLTGLLLVGIFFFVGVELLLHPRDLKVVFCDVGQGDAALIKAPSGQVVLIDGGPDSSVLECLGKNLSFWRRRIDFMVLSHYHDDQTLRTILQ
jgi:beta-lactamase superfamily II metal-dependent hydrolase